MQPIGHEQTNGPQTEVRAALASHAGCEVLLSWQVFIVTIILILLCASASAGLAIGLLATLQSVFRGYIHELSVMDN